MTDDCSQRNSFLAGDSDKSHYDHGLPAPTAEHGGRSRLLGAGPRPEPRSGGGCAGDSRAVLQMPRGNLEVVQPRVLCLAAIAEALQVQTFTAHEQAVGRP